MIMTHCYRLLCLDSVFFSNAFRSFCSSEHFEKSHHLKTFQANVSSSSQQHSTLEVFWFLPSIVQDSLPYKAST